MEGKKQMTYKELLWLEHPEYVDDKYAGGCKRCPCSYGYDDFKCGSSFSCAECWNREIHYPVIAKIVDGPDIFYRQDELGKEYIVEEVDMNSDCPVKLIGGQVGWYFNTGIKYRIDKSGEKIKDDNTDEIKNTEEFQMVKDFTKSDLKDGMIVEYRNGKRRIVLGEYQRGLYEYCRLDTFSHDLKNIDRDIDIMKIFPINNSCGTIKDILKSPGEPIWVRKEVKEIPYDEAIEVLKKHYGCEVTIEDVY